MRFVLHLLRHQRGATAVEYGLIVALIVLALVLGATTMAGVTVQMWRDVASKVVNAT